MRRAELLPFPEPVRPVLVLRGGRGRRAVPGNEAGVLTGRAGTTYELALASGSRLAIGPGDASAVEAVERFAAIMGLPPCGGEPRLRFVLSPSPASPGTAVPDGAFCPVPDGSGPDGLFVQLFRMSEAVARKVEEEGGLLLHAALAERGGVGVALAAPGGRGKSTASRRLPAPWRSLCDDRTLVVFGPDGPRAHPWPTWSRFLEEGNGGSWDVSRAVPLGGIFFLLRGNEDAVAPVGPGEAAAMLLESAEQASMFRRRDMPDGERRTLRVERLDSACRLAAAVPAFTLRLTVSGAFWEEVEGALGKCRRSAFGSNADTTRGEGRRSA